MHGLILTVLLLATPPPIEGAWPERVVYLGKPRSEEWLDKVYLHFRERLVEVEGAWVDTGDPVRYAAEIAPGTAGRVMLRPVKMIGADDFLAEVGSHDTRGTWTQGHGGPRQYHPPSVQPNSPANKFTGDGQVIRIVGAAPPKGDGIWKVRVAATGHDVVNGKRYVRCVPAPTDTKPLTRAQFLECIGSGFRLFEWRWRRTQPRGGVVCVWYRRYIK